jgi:hypothetical protein
VATFTPGTTQVRVYALPRGAFTAATGRGAFTQANTRGAFTGAIPRTNFD